MLKGGGSENCGCTYSIPSPEFEASRDIKGVRKAVLDAAYKAQGFGCAPGILGVGIGGDRATGMIKAKEQLFRPLGDRNPDPELDAVEKQLHREINELGHRPDGLRRQDDGAGGQDGRAAPPAGVVLRLDRVHVLGRPAEDDDHQGRQGGDHGSG